MKGMKLNMKELTIERMYELEKMVRDNNIIYPLSLIEFRYVERAEKMPYDEMKRHLKYLGESILPLIEIRYIYHLLAIYKCTYEELNQRFKDVCLVKKYEDMINTNLLKEQKRMIKRMNNR